MRTLFFLNVMLGALNFVFVVLGIVFYPENEGPIILNAVVGAFCLSVAVYVKESL